MDVIKINRMINVLVVILIIFTTIITSINAKISTNHIDENTTYNFTLNLIDNNPPITPIITGFTEYKTGIGYEFCIENATDPEGHSMFVFWDWDDDTNDSMWYGPYDTGEDICAIHTWDEKGTYTIRAKLRDAYGLESNWGYLIVTIHKNKEFLDWPMTYGLLFGKIEEPYIEKNNNVDYLNFYARNVYFFYLTYGFGGLDFFFFDKIPEKDCRMSLGRRGSFYGFFDTDSIFGRYNGYYP
jgi:hypothetical protein